MEGEDDGLAHGGGLAEADLALGGVDVDVDRGGVEVEEEEEDGAAAGVERRVGLAHGRVDGRGGGGAAVDEEELLGAVRAGAVGQAREAPDADAGERGVDRAEPLEELRAVEVAEAVLEGIAGRELVQEHAVALEREGDAVVGECERVEHRAHERLLGLVGAQELAARREVEEEVAHLDERAGRAAAVAHVDELPADDLDLGAGVERAGACAEAEARD